MPDHRTNIASAMGDCCLDMLDELIAETPDPDAYTVRKIKTVDGHHLKLRMDYLGFTGPETIEPLTDEQFAAIKELAGGSNGYTIRPPDRKP